MPVMTRFKRILHPSDFSRASAGAFAKAVQLAKDNRAELVVLHVITLPLPVMTGDGYVSPAVFEALRRSSRAWAQRQLDRLVARAKKAGARARGVLVEGTPYEHIAR